ncbi:hypothetical protein D3C84_718900 [compost metagenome]
MAQAVSRVAASSTPMRTQVVEMPKARAWLSPICINVSCRQSRAASTRPSSASGLTVITADNSEADSEPRFQ